MFPESACGGRREENEKIFPLGEVRYFGWVAAGRMDGAGRRGHMTDDLWDKLGELFGG